VNVVRLESLIVIVILVGLLLQLPRLDDPPELRLVGGEIVRVEDIEGAALYVDMGSSGTALVQVSEMRMHEDPTGAAYVTKLDGLVLAEGGTAGRLLVDVTEQASRLGWRPVVELDGIILPGADGGRHALEVSRLRLRRAIYKGRDVLFVVSRVEGRDLVTGRVIADEYIQGAVCPAIPLLKLTDACAAAGARGTESCLTLAGTVCWQNGRGPLAQGSPVWTAGYRYN